MESTDWIFDEGSCAWNVGNGDVDNDGVVEMITVGCTALKGLCDPDMRIWSLPQKTIDYSSYLPFAASTGFIFTIICFLVYFNSRRAKPDSRKS